MQQFIEYVIYGLLLGVSYGLVALPVSLVYATTRTIDSAVGAHAMVAGIVAGTVGGLAGIVLGLAAGMVTAAVAGVLYITMKRRDVDNPISVVLVTFGLGLVLESVILSTHGHDPVVVHSARRFWEVGGVSLNPQSLLNLTIGLCITALLVLALKHTRFGRGLRACADNPVGAALGGIPVARMQFLAIALGGLLAGAAGVLLVNSTGLTAFSHLSLTLTAIGAAVIFGFKGPVHNFAGGLVFGTVEGLVGGYGSSSLTRAIPFAFLLLVLAVGRQTVVGVRP